MKRLLSTIAVIVTVFLVTLPVLAQDDVTAEATSESTEEVELTEEAETEASCFVITDSSRTIRVRVGPGENRTSVTFLPVEEEIPVLGETEDDDGNLWYRLDKELAAPGRAINEAWIAVENDDLETIGDCDDVGDATAPPIIPIITQAPPTSDNVDEASDDDETAIVEGSRPSNGDWTLGWNGTTNVSCVGTDNVIVSTTEIFGQPGAGVLPQTTMLLNITRPDAEAPFMFMFTPMYEQGNGSYRGQINFFDNDGTILPATIVVNSASSNRMSGYMIVSAGECSGTVSFTASV